VINNLDEAAQYFLNKNSKEDLDLEIVDSIRDNYGNPAYHIIKRKDNNYYFLSFRERWRTGFDKEFDLPGCGDGWSNINLDVLILAAFEYNNAAVAVVLGNGKIYYARSLDIYNLAAKNNTLISKSKSKSNL
jgi:hypothetical protein